jgi:hypothetical protein
MIRLLGNSHADELDNLSDLLYLRAEISRELEPLVCEFVALVGLGEHGEDATRWLDDSAVLRLSGRFQSLSKVSSCPFCRQLNLRQLT